MIYFDSGGLVGQTFLMEEDDDGSALASLRFLMVLKKFKCPAGEDEFEEILSYNKEMQHIEKNNDDGDTI
jgi:hypothetical protein